MSLSSVLSIANSALTAQSYEMNSIAENISNATTPGYTAESVALTPSTPQETPQGPVGTGVTIGDTTRMRNAFLDESYRSESGLSGNYSTMQTLMGQVQSAFAEPTSAGLSNALSGFFNSFSNLTSDPSNSTYQLAAQQAGQTLAQTFQSVSGSLTAVGQNALSQLQSNVTQANQLLSQITQLNQQIVAAQGTGGAPTLQDQRDTAIDQLSSLMNIRTVQYNDGSVGVIAGTTVVANESASATLSVITSGAGFGVSANGTTPLAGVTGGAIGALSTFTQTTLPGIQNQLNQLASSVVTSVNNLTQSGTVTNSNPPVTGVPFFNPTGTTANNIALSTQVAASPSNIVTGTTGSPGDGSIALQISQLANNPVASLGNQSIPTFYGGIVSNMAAETQNANQNAAAQSTLLSNISSQRSAADGVNTDTQLIDLIQTQQAYSAATHLVSAADQMLQSLIQSVAA